MSVDREGDAIIELRKRTTARQNTHIAKPIRAKFKEYGTPENHHLQQRLHLYLRDLTTRAVLTLTRKRFKRKKWNRNRNRRVQKEQP